MHGLETIVKRNDSNLDGITGVYPHCVQFKCPNCGKWSIGNDKDQFTHDEKGQLLVECYKCFVKFPARQLPL